MTARYVRWLVVGLAGAVAGCGGGPIRMEGLAPVPAVRPADVDVTLLLIGDAGEPDLEFEPVLAALEAEAAEAPERTTVIYLGDNLYPHGMPDSGHSRRVEAERWLDAQVQAVRRSGARGYFVPGNHDWDGYRNDGWEAMRRQGRFVAERGAGRVVLLPADGCPGPEVVDVGHTLRLVLLDTQWWLEDDAKPRHPESTCATDLEGEVTDSLRGALRAAGSRKVVVVAHHPLESGGPHGGHFDWKDHIFPLRHLHPVLWIPLPIVGSAYPLIRGAGVRPQDFGSTEYEALRDSLRSAFVEHPPLVYAAGHEHNLQVLRGEVAGYLAVSGAGIYGHVNPVHRLDSTLFADDASGYMRLDVTRDRRARLSVRRVNGSGQTVEVFALWLDESGGAVLAPS